MEEDVPVTSVIKVNLTLQDLLVSYTTMVWQQRKTCSNKEGWCIRESQQRADRFILWPMHSNTFSAVNNGLKIFKSTKCLMAGIQRYFPTEKTLNISNKL